MIRKAKISDIKQIQALINGFARRELMLARSLNELYENLRDFWVADESGRVAGCAALHISWDDLAEIKCLAVARNRQKKGLGRQLAEACLDEAKRLGAKKVFALTYEPEFFKRLGFKKTTHAKLPHKVWAECINCTKFPNCKEIALLKVL